MWTSLMTSFPVGLNDVWCWVCLEIQRRFPLSIRLCHLRLISRLCFFIGWLFSDDTLRESGTVSVSFHTMLLETQSGECLAGFGGLLSVWKSLCSLCKHFDYNVKIQLKCEWRNDVAVKPQTQNTLIMAHKINTKIMFKDALLITVSIVTLL